MPDVTRYPDFYCIGSQRSGTTWLHRRLEGHPGAFTAPAKEVHFFDSLYVDMHRDIHAARIRAANEYFEALERDCPTPLRRLARKVVMSRTERRAHRRFGWWLAQKDRPVDDDWYASVFAGARPSQRVFDVTPAYAVLPPEGIEHVRRLNPAARIVLILRDPVERALSHARMLAAKAKRPLSDETLLELSTSPVVVSRDRVDRIIDAWTDAFGESQLLVVFYDQLRDRPYTFLRTICEFVGLRYSPLYFPMASRAVYRGQSGDVGESVRARLLELHAPVLEELHRRYPVETREWGTTRPSG